MKKMDDKFVDEIKNAIISHDSRVDSTRTIEVGEDGRLYIGITKYSIVSNLIRTVENLEEIFNRALLEANNA